MRELVFSEEDFPLVLHSTNGWKQSVEIEFHQWMVGFHLLLFIRAEVVG